jgi:hypothetical protein
VVKNEGQERQTDRDRDDRDESGDASHLVFEWTLVLLDTLGQRGDPAELGVHARREH